MMIRPEDGSEGTARKRAVRQAREDGLLPWWIDSAERSLSEAEAATAPGLLPGLAPRMVLPPAGG